MDTKIIFIVIVIIIIGFIILVRENFDNFESINNIVKLINENEIKSLKVNATSEVNAPTMNSDNIIGKNINTTDINSTNTNSTNITSTNIDTENISVKKINGIQYLFDTNAEIQMCKQTNGIIEGNHKFDCIAYGYYDPNSSYAIINVPYFSSSFNLSGGRWIHFLQIKVNGITFYPINYNGCYLTDTNGKCIDTIPKINLNQNNSTGIETRHMRPAVVGEMKISEDQRNVWALGTDIASTWYVRFHPTEHKINGKTTYLIKDETDGGNNYGGVSASNFVAEIQNLFVSSKQL